MTNRLMKDIYNVVNLNSSMMNSSLNMMNLNSSVMNFNSSMMNLNVMNFYQAYLQEQYRYGMHPDNT